MRPVLMSSEGHWDKQALVCAVSGGRVGVGWRKSGDLGWEIARLFQADGLPSYNAAESPHLSPTNFGASFPLILFCMKANVLIYDFFSLQCVRLETPVVVKLP